MTAQHRKKPSKAPSPILPLHLPTRFASLAEYAVLPLRLFLGVTFVVAGLQKIANPDFFSMTSPTGIHATMVSIVSTSPIGSFVHSLLGFSTGLGWLIALGELYIGLSTILGLWTRIAAFCGAIISLSFFLTVSWTTAPYYYGSDIVFFFAWTALIIAGGGSHLSLDGWLEARAARELNAESPEIVAIPFAQVQNFCGNFQKGSCRAQQGKACSPDGCPVLNGERGEQLARRIDAVDRRRFVTGAAGAGALAAVAAVGAGVAAGVGHSSSSGSTTTTVPGETTTTVASAGTKVANASDVAINTAVSITLPNNDPGILIHDSAGNFVCYDAVCPHAGCQVGFSPSTDLIVCPCHGSQFQVSDGAYVAGPAPSGLIAYTVTETGGSIYIS